MPFHSQFGEDKFLSEGLFKDCVIQSRPYSFCEVGAFDGVQSSNTLHFEEDLGWWGLCLEPLPRQWRVCRQNRSCMVLDFAVSMQKGMIDFFMHESDQGRSGILSEGFGISVNSDQLGHILESLNLMSLDLLSIDTEGTELEVWESIGNYRPRVVIMEYLTWGKPSREMQICERMARDGYKEIHRTEANLIFEFKA